MIIDAHLHCSGKEQTDDVLQSLDEAGVEQAILLAPFLNPPYTLYDRISLRAANKHLVNLIARHRDRLSGFAVINPLLADALEDANFAIEELGLSGLKLVPTGWFPYDECAHRIYERAAYFNIPILFHSGIFIDGKSGRYCRPCFYEAVREHTGLRVTLAHLGWPWCDEANAVGVIDLINGVSPDLSQFRFDISFGAPPIYRTEVLRKAIDVLTPNLLQFGSDCFLPCSGQHIKHKIDEVTELMNELNVDRQSRERIMSGTAAAWLRDDKTSKLNRSKSRPTSQLLNASSLTIALE